MDWEVIRLAYCLADIEHQNVQKGKATIPIVLLAG